MPKPLDKQTQKIMTEQEKVSDWVKSEGWQIVKQKLYHKLGELNSIVSIPTDVFSKPAELNNEIAQRYNAIALVQSWIKEIEGIANKNDFDKRALQKETLDQIIIEYPVEN